VIPECGVGRSGPTLSLQWAFEGCHVTRDISSLIRQGKFKIEQLYGIPRPIPQVGIVFLLGRRASGIVTVRGPLPATGLHDSLSAGTRSSTRLVVAASSRNSLSCVSRR
jgi:hypothetical protein